MNKKLFGIVGLVLVAGVLGGGKAVAVAAAAAADNDEGYIYLYNGVAFNKATREYEVTYGPYPAVEEQARAFARQVGKRNYTGVTYEEFDNCVPISSNITMSDIRSKFLDGIPSDKISIGAAGFTCTLCYKQLLDANRSVDKKNVPYSERYAQYLLFGHAFDEERAKLKTNLYDSSAAIE
ncbi:MAG: hypothetical protein LBG13_03235 [Holosporales bacterium]|jgi:hypothetical protein|nr:hypothetical protein [Holosporales bacterium]